MNHQNIKQRSSSKEQHQTISNIMTGKPEDHQVVSTTSFCCLRDNDNDDQHKSTTMKTAVITIINSKRTDSVDDDDDDDDESYAFDDDCESCCSSSSSTCEDNNEDLMKNPFDSVTTSPWVIQSLQACESNLSIDNSIARISHSSLCGVDQLLGQGGFCNVYQVSSSEQQQDDEEDHDFGCTRTKYAMKCLNPNKIFVASSQQEDTTTEIQETYFVLAAADLAMEACLLSTLNHHNIIRLQGISNVGFCDSFTTTPNGFFLLMDILKNESLFDLLIQWRQYYATKSRGRGLGRKFVRTLSSRGNFHHRKSPPRRCATTGSERTTTRGRRKLVRTLSMGSSISSHNKRSPTRTDNSNSCDFSLGTSEHGVTGSPPRRSPMKAIKRLSGSQVQRRLSSSVRSTDSHDCFQGQLSSSVRNTSDTHSNNSRISTERPLSSSVRSTSSYDSQISSSSTSYPPLTSSSSCHNNIHQQKTHHQKKQKPPSCQERFDDIAVGIVNGLEYLHSQGIVYRDLKPANIGFDLQSNTIKLFDFGLARKVSDLSPDQQQQQEAAGSYRYMAPEMLLKKNEDESDINNSIKQHPNDLLSMDVYSLGVLLWELFTLQRPYSSFLDNDTTGPPTSSSGGPSDIFLEKVVEQGWRHPVSDIPNTELGKLIQDCWHSNPQERPTLKQIQTWLEETPPKFEIKATSTHTIVRRRRTSLSPKSRGGGGPTTGHTAATTTTNIPPVRAQSEPNKTLQNTNLSSPLLRLMSLGPNNNKPTRCLSEGGGKSQTKNSTIVPLSLLRNKEFETGTSTPTNKFGKIKMPKLLRSISSDPTSKSFTTTTPSLLSSWSATSSSTTKSTSSFRNLSLDGTMAAGGGGGGSDEPPGSPLRRLSLGPEGLCLEELSASISSIDYDIPKKK